MFVNTKVTASRRCKRWSELTHQQQTDLLACDCGKGQQDAYHVWFECDSFSRYIAVWFKTLNDGMPVLPALQQTLQGMSSQQILAYFLTLPNGSDSTAILKYKAQGAASLVRAVKKFDMAVLDNQLYDFNLHFDYEVDAYLSDSDSSVSDVDSQIWCVHFIAGFLLGF